MTACVNKKSKRVAAVVTASLVGALSIGAPAVALADTTVDMLVAPEENAFSRGEVTLYGAGLKQNDDKVWEVQAKADGSALDIKATQVTPLGGSVVNINSDYKVSFAKADGTAVDSIVEPGQYVVTVECLKGQYAGGKATAKLAVKAADLKGVTAFESAETLDSTFVYSGKKLNVDFVDRGMTKLVEGEDYSVKILKEGTDNVAAAPSVDVLAAGNYVGYMTGLGQYAGETAEVHFTVEQFDFDNADITIDDVIASESAPKHPTKVTNGVKGMENYVELDPSLVDLAFDSAASGSQLFDKPGSYTFKATVDNTDGNFVYKNGPRSKEVSKVAAYADFKYGDDALADSYSINLDKKQSFDLDSVKAYNGKKEAKGVTVSAVKADGTTAASGELGAGTWTVTVKVDAKANDYAVGGTKTFTVKVVRASLDADANVFVYYKNEAVTSIEKTYDKKAIHKTDFTVKAFKDDNTNVSDKVSFNIYDEDGKKVDKIVDAGTYTLKIETDELELTGTTEITITVNKVDLSKLYVMQEKKWFDEESGAPYVPLASDGKSLGFDTVLGYDTQAELTTDKDSASDGVGIDQIGRKIAGKDFTSQVKAERYDVKKGKWVEVSYPNIFTVAGEYRFTLTGTADDAKNYKFANADNTTVVTTLCVDEKDLVFRDVLPGEWYFDAVADAKGLGYVAGVSGSKYYQPTAAIKRCDVIVILARMAGVDTTLNGMTEDEFSKGYGIYLDYNDVDESSYYARALAWATKVDIAHGSNGAFRPNDTITREEFAALLSNYAMLNGKDVSVDA
ncbi:S-layer homology domain-containing protein, partial [Collinsella tanakaei]|uniref:S-layer homology domain-containing protein n=1 Tax=Collinsella tanakaei TaxID=626935 RepID=UPI0026EAD8E1